MLNLHNAKLMHNRIIVRLTLVLLVLAGTILPSPTTSLLPVTEVEAQTCPPHGYVTFSWGYWYDWIANGTPLDSSCWGHTNASVVSTTACGWTSNAWEFYYAGTISQFFTIPSDWHQPNFGIQYLLDFDDPNNDGVWNKFSMEVKDLNTGAVLASDAFNGSMGDLYCSSRSKSWSQDLAGHQIQVRFKGSRAYQSTFIRIRMIALFQRLAP